MLNVLKALVTGGPPYEQYHGPRRFQESFFTLAGRLLDVWGGLIWRRRLAIRTSGRPSDIEDLSDDEIHEAYVRTFEVVDIPLPQHFRDVTALTPHTLMKRMGGFDGLPPAEFVAMQLVKDSTSIPIPTVHRCARRTIVTSSNLVGHWFLLVMERLDATPLSRCWSTLPWLERLRVIWVLRQYVNQLRLVKNPHPDRPGPLGESLRRKEEGGIFHDTAETFSSSEHLSNWFTERANPLARWRGDSPPPKSPFPDPTPLVFTHGDIHPGNVLLDRSGRVWLIDWGCAGFYPRWFEYLTAVQVSYNVKAPTSWRFLLPLITGPSFANEYWAESMRVVWRPNEEHHNVGMDALFVAIKKWLGFTITIGSFR